MLIYLVWKSNRIYNKLFTDVCILFTREKLMWHCKLLLISLFFKLKIRNRWKLQSIEQQQKDVQEKQEAKEQAKKARGNNNNTTNHVSDVYLNSFTRPMG